ncbi:hypothetical protein WICMUC_002841 [Wickerhamomyces mucosus]|uniref:Nucleoporin Nup133/Nup155-like C-terminal domain-containing protein n=1 Tax=Wickerhamomyces mucosus TaxID=1378264 RepID=A0A9P8PP84_9ASCO|nr:hypothetical protein WICMUC_002841 [Wickerhamomyces mucosus]
MTTGFSPKISGFSARGFVTDNIATTNSETHNKDHDFKPASKTINASIELTRNAKYIVSKLPATPLALKSLSDPNGLIDGNTSYGLLISNESIYTWNYNSVDGVPNTVQLPVIPSNNGFPPIALLVLPSAGSVEPGVISINSHTGHVRFYENISNASSIGLLKQHKGIDYLIKLYDKEFITFAEAIEPAGIIFTTSTGRLILLSFRDAAGKPHITTSEISGRKTSFFSSYLHPSKQIISIKAGPTVAQGERIVATITTGGNFQIWACARDGQSREIYQHEILDLLINHIKELYPAAQYGLEVLDFALLKDVKDADVFLVLTSFQTSDNESVYVLFTIKKEQEVLLIHSVYRLNTISEPYGERKPSLHVPSPGTTAFIVFENTVVLVEAIVKLEKQISNHRRKWEDIISFRSDISIIASSNDSETTIPAINLIAPKVGILRIESLNHVEEIDEQQTVSPVVKSHIEQAVFYGELVHQQEETNPIEFGLPENFNIEQSEIENDVLEVAEEILLSKSSYLPPRLSGLESHLELRKEKLEKLVEYASINFHNKIRNEVKISLIFTLEKITSALNLFKIITAYESNAKVVSIFDQTVKEFFSNNPELLLSGLDKLEIFLSKFLERLSKAKGLEDASAEIVKAAYSSILEVEKQYRYGLFNLSLDDISKDLPWFVHGQTYIYIDDIFQNYTNKYRDGQFSNQKSISSEITIGLAEILFYQLQQRILWYNSTSPKTREITDIINNDKAFYNAKSGIWTKTLVLFNAKTEALAISETYEDLKSLVEISDEDRENASSNDEELDRINLRFDHYFNKFGYPFAETLYNYYIHTSKYQALFFGFKQYNSYLQRFFAENDHGKISWIEDILNGDFSKASKVLLSVSNKNDESQSNRQLQLSIAKLSAIASIDESSIDHESQDILQDIQEELDLSEAQDAIWEQIKEFIRSDSDPLAQVDSIVKDLLNPIYKSSSIFKNSFERALSRLLSYKSLSINEIIDIFTLLNSSKTSTKLNGYYALKVLHLSNLSYLEKCINETLIWKRVILSDDWVRIFNNEENKSDEYIKELNEQTVLYQTLLNFFRDELYILNNDYSISLPDIKKLILPISQPDNLLEKYKFLSSTEVNELLEEIQTENQEILEIFTLTSEFDQWIKALIGTANENSGVKKVIINYNDLSIQN